MRVVAHLGRGVKNWQEVLVSSSPRSPREGWVSCVQPCQHNAKLESLAWVTVSPSHTSRCMKEESSKGSWLAAQSTAEHGIPETTSQTTHKKNVSTHRADLVAVVPDTVVVSIIKQRLPWLSRTRKFLTSGHNHKVLTICCGFNTFRCHNLNSSCLLVPVWSCCGGDAQRPSTTTC